MMKADKGSLLRDFDTALAAHQKRNFAVAEALYSKILKQDRRHDEANRLLALIRLNAGQMNDAKVLLKRAIGSNPNNARAQFALASVYEKQGKPVQAKQAYGACLKLGQFQVESHNNLGLINKREHNYAQAATHFREAIAANPNSAQSWANLGNALNDMGDIDAAVDCFQQAVKLNPGFSEAFSNLLLTLNYSDKATPELMADKHALWERCYRKLNELTPFSFKNRARCL